MVVRIVPDEGKIQDTARRLLDATDNPFEVQTETDGSGLVFVVSDDLASKAGFDVADEDETDGSEPSGDSAGNDGSDSSQVKPPPRAGAGATIEAWKTFLTEQGIEYPANADRGDLIELWDTRS